MVDEELKSIRSHREAKEENQEAMELKRVIARLQEKVKHRDDMLEKKAEKDLELIEKHKKYEEKLNEKDEEIATLSGGIYQLESLQAQFDQKDVEIENMIMRMAEAAEQNEGLGNEVRMYDEKLTKKTHYINELKERSRAQRNEMEEQKKVNETRIKRLEMQISHLDEQIRISAENNQAVNLEEVGNYDLNQSIISNANPGGGDLEENDLEGAGDLNFINVNDIDQHSQFRQESRQASFLSQGGDLGMQAQMSGSFRGSEFDHNQVSSYRFDQTERELIGLHEDEPAQVQVNIYESDDEDQNQSSFNSRSPIIRSMVEEKDVLYVQDIELMKNSGSSKPHSQSVLHKDTGSLNFHQLEERCLHFERTSNQYEKLYIDYLQKYILTSKDKELLLYKTRRVNCLISKTASILARYDALEIW